jgi:serine/threonine protein kinase
MVMFFFLLKKINKAHKRALAGYAKNTININSHSHAFFGCIVYYVFWGIGCTFDLNRDYTYRDLNSPGLWGTDVIQLTPLIIGSTVCRSFTNFLESYIVVLLISDSIGKDTFRRAMLISIFLLCMYMPTSMTIIIWFPGATSSYWPLRNLALLYLVRDVVTVSYTAAAYFYIRNRKSQAVNDSISRYLVFMCGLYSMYIMARCCYLTTNVPAVNFGICVDDFLHFIQFANFGPLAYLALKRDCQYWATDIDNENELTLMSHTENMAWSEINDRNDAIIPKTEIYYRKTIEERCDVSVEIHFWRRRQVVVKRFKLDLLTRDNIKYFKDEASVFKTLQHPNIIAFYGILVDPPSLGIVMQFASKGDLFKHLESKLEAWRRGMLEGDQDEDQGQRENNRDSEARRSSVATRRDSIPVAATAMTSSGAGDDNDVTSSPLSLPSSPLSLPSSDIPSSPARLDPASPTTFPPPASSSPSIVTRFRRTSLFSGSPASPSTAAALIEMTNRTAQFHSVRCALQIALGMHYLHSNNVCHHDLKSLNILLDDRFNAMIADFGESKFEEDIQFRDSSSQAAHARNRINSLESTESVGDFVKRGPEQVKRALARMAHMLKGGAASEEEDKHASAAANITHHHHRGEVGTPGWAAPECIEGLAATKTSDVFSFGIILWELCTWLHPSVHVPVTDLTSAPLSLLPGIEDWVGLSNAGHAGAGAGGGADHHHHQNHQGSSSSQRNRLSLSRILSGLVGEDPDSLRAGKATRETFDKRISQLNPMQLVLIDTCEKQRARALMLDLNKRPPIPAQCHPVLASVMLRCWSTDQSSRPTFADIIVDLQRVLADFERTGDPSFPMGLGGGGPCSV